LSAEIEERHVENAKKARELYLDNLKPSEARADWHFALRESRRLAAKALRDSQCLSDIAGALKKNGAHNLVFRQMLAPPVSQDQFKLRCHAWSKTSENDGTPVPSAKAIEILQALLERIDSAAVRWKGRLPRRDEMRLFLSIVPTLLALQRVSTARRKRLAFEQEFAVVEMLENDGWIKLPSKLIDERAAVPTRHFMHKTRFATATTTPQEVDIACGLKGSYVLAMECKVTNDETNSIKRINDVLKKAESWKSHWGSFVSTAALLQGIIKPRDVQRLTDANVEVFWSHDLDAFKTWVTSRI
jgi:hypothetical protein